MQINMKALKTLELKLLEYSKENVNIAEHESGNVNFCYNCKSICKSSCIGNCRGSCADACTSSSKR